MREAHDARVCPYFHANIQQCSRRFTLEHMSEVFEFCLGDHARCNIYTELTIQGERMGCVVLAQAG
ncbi:MAG: hypothetical protein HUU22_15235 [Phycisphaerae bacterium]|nr:hypothetical protein [Phycisphaerae bacterium]NUQ47377.1 hypothetical protein [Phycisphaerae bacterium]